MSSISGSEGVDVRRNYSRTSSDSVFHADYTELEIQQMQIAEHKNKQYPLTQPNLQQNEPARHADSPQRKKLMKAVKRREKQIQKIQARISKMGGQDEDSRTDYESEEGNEDINNKAAVRPTNTHPNRQS